MGQNPAEVAKPVMSIADLDRADSLIDRLDPYRDYGDLGYEGVVAGVKAGRITLLPVSPTQAVQQPMIRDAQTNRTLKGTGQMASSGWTKPIESNKRLFNELAMGDFLEVYAALKHSCVVDRDPRALKIYFEQVLGQPTKSLEGGASKEVVELMTMLAKGSATQTKPIDAEGRYIDVDSS